MDVLGAMRTFVAVAEEDSLTGAAKRLSVSKALVSRTLQSLEAHLNTRLLNRTTRRLSLTEAGTAYLEHCRAMLAQNEAFEIRLRNLADEPSGRLRVSAPVSLGLAEIAPLVSAFRASHPAVEFDLDLTDRFVDLVDEGIDLAIRVGDSAPDSAISARLGETAHLLVASPALIEAQGGAPLTLDGLHDWPLTEFKLKAPAHGWRRTQRRAPVALRSNSGDVLLRAALDGVGLAFLPRFFLTPHLENGALVALFPEEARETNPILALYPHLTLLPRKTRLFLDFLRETLRGRAL